MLVTARVKTAYESDRLICPSAASLVPVQWAPCPKQIKVSFSKCQRSSFQVSQDNYSYCSVALGRSSKQFVRFSFVVSYLQSVRTSSTQSNIQTPNSQTPHQLWASRTENGYFSSTPNFSHHNFEKCLFQTSNFQSRVICIIVLSYLTQNKSLLYIEVSIS